MTAVMLRGKSKGDTLVVPQNISLHFLCGLTHVYGKLYILVPNFIFDHFSIGAYFQVDVLSFS